MARADTLFLGLSTLLSAEAAGGPRRAASPQRSLRSVGARRRRLRLAARIGLGAIAWALLMLVRRARDRGDLLGRARGRDPPQRSARQGDLGVAVVLALHRRRCSGWSTKSVTPKRIVRRIVALGVGASAPRRRRLGSKLADDALFVARDMAWGDRTSSTTEVPRAPSAQRAARLQVQVAPVARAFQPIKYTVGGKARDGGFDEFLRSTNTTSFIVIKDDAILYEGYFNGYSRDSIVTSFSMAKSVTSALVGIAIDEGYIGSVDDPIVAYLPELRAAASTTVTIRHLLLMSSGIRYVQDEDLSGLQDSGRCSDDALSYSYPNLRRLALQLPPSKEPAGRRSTTTPTTRSLLGMILERTTHRPVAEYLQEKIWQPLGMEYPASWSLDSEASGFEKMESGLNGRAIDFAKFGRLFLDNGNWNGKQIDPDGVGDGVDLARSGRPPALPLVRGLEGRRRLLQVHVVGHAHAGRRLLLQPPAATSGS